MLQHLRSAISSIEDPLARITSRTQSLKESVDTLQDPSLKDLDELFKKAVSLSEGLSTPPGIPIRSLSHRLVRLKHFHTTSTEEEFI